MSLDANAVFVSLSNLQQLTATLPAEQRRDFWSWLVGHARAQQQSQMLGERGGVAGSWDACLRMLIEEEANSLQQLLQGLAVSSVVHSSSSDPYIEGLSMLRRCQEWIGTEPDSIRQASLLQYLADHLVQVLGRLHQWLVIEDAKGLERAEWFWRGWDLLQWRLTFDVPLPPWWPPLQEQVVRLGALAWHERAEESDPLQSEGQEAITRALCLLQALVTLHSPLPAWIPQRQRQLAEQGLKVLLQCDPFSDKALQQVLFWLELLQPATAEQATAVEREEGLIRLRDQLADLDLSVLLPDGLRWHLEEREAIAQADQLLLQGEWQQARLILENLTVSSHVRDNDFLRIKKDDFSPKLDISGKVKARQQLASKNLALDLCERSPELRPRIAICTHHKCGTAFLLKTFNQIKNRLGLKLWKKFYEAERIDGEHWDIVFEQHSRIEGLEKGLKGIHCIRRPESLIFSAALYHEQANEPWLDVPIDKFDHNTYRAYTEAKPYNIINDQRIEASRKAELAKGYKSRGFIPCYFEAPYEFGGKSYRNMLKSFKSTKDKLRFEMQCYSFGVISDMIAFSFADFYWIRLEDVSFDVSMRELRNAFRFIGFKGDELTICLDSARTNILGANPNAAGKHGTTGVSSEWRDLFEGQLGKEYNSIYGDASEALGYE